MHGTPWVNLVRRSSFHMTKSRHKLYPPECSYFPSISPMSGTMTLYRPGLINVFFCLAICSITLLKKGGASISSLSRGNTQRPEGSNGYRMLGSSVRHAWAVRTPTPINKLFPMFAKGSRPMRHRQAWAYFNRKSYPWREQCQNFARRQGRHSP